MKRPKKKLVVQHHTKGREEREVDTIEEALKDLAKEAKAGDLSLPVVVSFDGPNGLSFMVTINTPVAAQEISTMGFMF